MNKNPKDTKKNIMKEVRRAKRNSKPDEMLGHSVKFVDELRDAYNKQPNKMKPQMKSITIHKIKNGSYTKMKKDAMKNLDELIEKSDLKNPQLESLKQMIVNNKKRKMSKQKKELAMKLFTSITHDTKDKRSKTKTKKKRKSLKKKRKSKTLKNSGKKEMKGGFMQWWDYPLILFVDVIALFGWIPVAVFGFVLYEIVDILQAVIGVGENNYLTFDSLFRFLHTSDWIMAPYDWVTSVGSWPGELANDAAMILSDAPSYAVDIAERGAEALTLVDETIIDDGLIPLATGTISSLENAGESLYNFSTTTVGTIASDATSIGTSMLTDAESYTETSLFPSMSNIISIILKVIMSQTFLAALLTTIPAYLIYERQNIQNAYDNISKYGWLISLFPTDIEADNDFYCEEKINLEEELKKIDELFNIEEILNTPRILLKIVDELKINGRQISQFQEVIETDLKNIDINIFTKKEMFESDFEKFRLQINISKNIEFTRKMITFRKQIIEKSNEFIISVQSMKLNNTFERNKQLLRVVLGKIIDKIKETIKDGYEYCMEKSGHDESDKEEKKEEKEENDTTNNKTKKNILEKSLSRTQKNQ